MKWRSMSQSNGMCHRVMNMSQSKWWDSDEVIDDAGECKAPSWRWVLKGVPWQTPGLLGNSLTGDLALSHCEWDWEEPVAWWWWGPECWPVPAWGSQLIPECCPIPDCESKLVSKVGLEPKLSLCNPTSISSSPSELECDNLVLSWGAGWREWVPSLSVGEDCCRWAPCWKTPVCCLWGVNSTAAERLLLEACSWRVAKAVGGGGGFRGGFGCFVWGLDVFFVHLGFAGVSGTTGSS